MDGLIASDTEMTPPKWAVLEPMCWNLLGSLRSGL